MNSKQKKMLTRILVALAIFAGLMIFEEKIEALDLWFLSPILFAVPFLIAGYDILLKAAKNIAKGQVFDENFLMIVASIGAYATGEYSEAVAVIIFYQVGELFQSYAVGKSRQSIADMMNICPEYANVETEDGISEEDPEDVEIGSIIVIRPGEKVPIDSVVIEGESFLDTSALTGESVPRKATVGDQVISGCINGAGTLKCRTEKAFEDSTVSKVLELVESASSRKSKAENFITKFAKYYTPIVTIAAVVLAVVPSIITGNWAEWVGRACTFLVISCPCALVISVPMGFFGGIGAASKAGVLIKGSNYFEVLANLDTVCFDKTGTLTKGAFEVVGMYPGECSEDKLLEIAAHTESYSTHPVAKSILDAYKVKGKDTDTSRISEVEELSGRGIKMLIDGAEALCGNEKLMKEMNISYTKCEKAGTLCYVAYAGKYLGCIVINDSIKDGVREALATVKSAGVSTCVMLTGDIKAAADNIVAEINAGHAGAPLLDKVYSDLLPQDKVAAVEELLAAKPEGKSLAFVGDGINDAPVLTRADVGFAMGSMGSDSAIEAADVVIMDDDILKIGTAVKIARKTIRIVRQNIVFALGVKILVLILGALGFASMWAAVFADVGVAVLAICNSMRALARPKN